MESGAHIHHRYRIERQLGSGSQGETWLARDEVYGVQVALKLFDLAGSGDWGDFDRFEREARVLRGINHPRIPDYVDQFELREGRLRFVLVQEYIEGTTIEQLVESGRRESFVEIRRITAELFEIVGYLQSISPVVVHRDINPRNVVLDASRQVYLVDFGGVQDSLSSGAGTVIGTPGYVPLEQFSGHAVPASDLYGAAATIVFLLTHRNPAELPMNRLKIDLAVACPGVPPELRFVLDRYLEPDAAERTLPVETAVAMLQGRESIPESAQAASADTDSTAETPAPAVASRDAGPPATGDPSAEAVQAPGGSEPLPALPSGSKIRYVTSSDGTETVAIPPGGARGTALVLVPFALFWNAFVAFWTFGAAAMGGSIALALFSLPFWAVGIGLIVKILKDLLERVEMSVSRSRDGVATFRLTRRLGPVTRTTELPVTEVGRPSVDTQLNRTGRSYTSCTFELGVRRVRLGSHLSEREQRWLCRFVAKHAGATV